MARKWKDLKEEKISTNGPLISISGTVVGVNEGTFNTGNYISQGSSRRKSIRLTKKRKLISTVNEADNEEDEVLFHIKVFIAINGLYNYYLLIGEIFYSLIPKY